MVTSIYNYYINFWNTWILYLFRFTELSPERYNIFSVVYEWTFHKYFIVIICYNSIIYSILKHTKIDL